MNEPSSRRLWTPPPHLKYVELLARHRRFIIVFTGTAMLTALALTYVFSEKYRSGVAIFYRHQEVTLMKAQDLQAFGSPAPNTPFKVISTTIEDIVMSEALLRPIVLDLNLHVSERVYNGPWYSDAFKRAKDFVKSTLKDAWGILRFGRIIEPDPVFATIQGLRESVSVVNNDSFIFSIIVDDSEPVRAAAIANEIGRRLVAFLREQTTELGGTTRQQLADLMREKDQQMVRYQNEIEALLEAHNMASVTEEVARGMERFSALELQRVQLEVSIQNERSRLAAIDRALDRRNSGSLQPSDVERLRSESVFVDVNLAGLIAQHESIETSLSALRDRLQALPALQLRLENLQTHREGVKRDWVQLLDARQEAELRETKLRSEVSVLHDATVPTTPISPVKIYHVGLAGMLGLLASSSLIFVLSYFNIRIFFGSAGISGRRAGKTRPVGSMSDKRLAIAE